MNDPLLSVASELGQIRGTVIAVKESQDLMRHENLRKHEEVKTMLGSMDERLGKRIDDILTDHDTNTLFRKGALWGIAIFCTAWVTAWVASAANLW